MGMHLLGVRHFERVVIQDYGNLLLKGQLRPPLLILPGNGCCTELEENMNGAK